LKAFTSSLQTCKPTDNIPSTLTHENCEEDRKSK